jgi:iduronate 2-sulfatase
MPAIALVPNSQSARFLSVSIRVHPWFSFFLALACLLVALTHSLAAAATRPNILFICVDDLKPLLGCYGDKQIHSPNIDRLAQHGMLFEHAYCNQAVCAPSRNSLLTGMRPTSSGIYDLGTNFRAATPDAVTLPQYFKTQGYVTEGLGKIFHVGHGNHEDPISWGIPHYSAKSIFYLLPESHPKNGLTREEALFANQLADPGKLPRGAPWEAPDVEDSAYPDGKIAEETVKRLRAANNGTGEPFFIAVGFLKPHMPFCAPKKYWDMYRREEFDLPALKKPPEGAPPYAPTTWGEVRQYSDIPETGPLSDDQARAMIHGYHAAVSFVDAQIGKVLDELDQLILWTNTVVVLWGDNGWHLGDHGMWSKHTNYEEATHIPLIIWAPGVTKPGTRTRAMVENVDLYPTLCELSHLPAPAVPQRLDGQSIVPVLKDPTKSIQDAVFHVFPRNRRRDGAILGRAIRTERYRLVEWKKPGASVDTADFELYDYEKDPAESRNLASTEPDLVKKLDALLTSQPEAKPQITARADRINN